MSPAAMRRMPRQRDEAHPDRGCAEGSWMERPNARPPNDHPAQHAWRCALWRRDSIPPDRQTIATATSLFTKRTTQGEFMNKHSITALAGLAAASFALAQEAPSDKTPPAGVSEAEMQAYIDSAKTGPMHEWLRAGCGEVNRTAPQKPIPGFVPCLVVSTVFVQTSSPLRTSVSVRRKV